MFLSPLNLCSKVEFTTRFQLEILKTFKPNIICWGGVQSMHACFFKKDFNQFLLWLFLHFTFQTSPIVTGISPQSNNKKKHLFSIMKFFLVYNLNSVVSITID